MKYALVTGSSRGIGLSVGIGLLQMGYYVFFNSPDNEDDLTGLKHQIGDHTNYSLIKADVSDLNTIHDIYLKIKEVTKTIDVVVFNAGTTDRTPFPEISPETWQKIQNIFVTFPVFLLQKLYPMLNRRGNIIFIGSMLGKIPHATSLPYGVSKAGVHALVGNLVKFFAEGKIRVNGVAPGFIDTDWQLRKPDEVRQKIVNKIALKQFGKPENVRDLVLHIINNEYINGTVVRIDGGYCFE